MKSTFNNNEETLKKENKRELQVFIKIKAPHATIHLVAKTTPE